MKKCIIGTALACVFGFALCGSAVGAFAAADTADTYTKDCGIAIPPVIAAEYAAGVTDGQEPPATVFLYLDETLSLADGTSLDEALSSLGGKAVPVLYVTEEAAADAVSAYVEGKGFVDGIVASDSGEILSRMRERCTQMQGLLDFRGAQIEERVEVRNSANSAGAKIVLLDAAYTSYDNVRWLQERLMTVWCEAETEEEVYAAAVSGCNGILAADAQNAYDVLSMFDEGTLLHLPMVVGHRGMYNEKQNTLAAAQEAFKAGADAVECDIYLTADDRIVIMHDSTLDSTTTGTGSVEDKTLAEIQQYEVDVGGGGVNRPIPTLDEFFAEFKGTDLVHFIEIKSSRPEIVPALKELIEEYGVSDQVVVISFLKDQLALVHEQIPELSVGYLTNTAYDYDAKSANQEVAPINATLNPGYEFMTVGLANELAPRGITVWPWTYPNNQNYDSAYMNGINGITTDYADRSADNVVRLLAEDIVLPNKDGDAVPLTATAVTQKGEEYEVSCDYIQIAGNMTILQNSEGNYYAGRGTAVLLLRYTFTSENTTYTLYSEPVNVSVSSQTEEEAPSGSGCSGSAAAAGGAVSALLLIAGALLLRKRAK